MCFCTPEIRTPWCGRVGCEQPGQERKSLNTRISELEAELEALSSLGDELIDALQNSAQNPHVSAQERAEKAIEAFRSRMD